MKKKNTLWNLKSCTTTILMPYRLSGDYSIQFGQLHCLKFISLHCPCHFSLSHSLPYDYHPTWNTKHDSHWTWMTKQRLRHRVSVYTMEIIRSCKFEHLPIYAVSNFAYSQFELHRLHYLHFKYQRQKKNPTGKSGSRLNVNEIKSGMKT